MAALGDIIAAAAARYGVNPADLMRTAQIESSMNPNASNPSGAAGLFQFIPSTARGYGLSNPYDPVAASDAGARLWRDNQVALARTLGREPTGPEVYLAHQQGPQGAGRMLTNMDAPAASIVGLKAVTQNGGSPDMTAGQFASMWMNKFAGGKSVAMPAAAKGSLAGQFVPQQEQQKAAAPTQDDTAALVAALSPQSDPGAAQAAAMQSAQVQAQDAARRAALIRTQVVLPQAGGISSLS